MSNKVYTIIIGNPIKNNSYQNTISEETITTLYISVDEQNSNHRKVKVWVVQTGQIKDEYIKAEITEGSLYEDHLEQVQYKDTIEQHSIIYEPNNEHILENTFQTLSFYVYNLDMPNSINPTITLTPKYGDSITINVGEIKPFDSIELEDITYYRIQPECPGDNYELIVKHINMFNSDYYTWVLTE